MTRQSREIRDEGTIGCAVGTVSEFAEDVGDIVREVGMVADPF